MTMERADIDIRDAVRLTSKSHPARGGMAPRRADIPDINRMEHEVLVLKIDQLEDKVDILMELVRQLSADRYPRFVGTSEACRILGIGHTTMDKRLAAGYYPFAVKENGRWRFPLAELYRFAGQL